MSYLEKRRPAHSPWHPWPSGELGRSGPGVDLDTIKNTLVSTMEMAASLSQSHSQTRGKAVNRSTLLSKHSSIKLKESQIKQVQRTFWAKMLDVTHALRMGSSVPNPYNDGELGGDSVPGSRFFSLTRSSKV